MLSSLRIIWIFIIINFLGLIGLASIYFVKSDRIAIVNSERIIEGYKGTATARKELESKAAIWTSNIDTLASDLRNATAIFQTGSIKMTAKERQLQDELINEKKRRLADYQRAIESQMAQQEQQITNSVLNEINAQIKKFGEERGYKIILAATEYGNVAFTSPELDITDELLVELNKQYIK